MNTTTATAAAGDAPRRGRANSAAMVVQQSGLPGALGELVLSVTGKCRLWRSERVEVARELCAHFLDGLEAGANPAQLAASFGDPRHAARLITATRKKLRPLWWRASRASLRGVGGLLLACLVLYAILAARFFLTSPSVKRNFMSELNAPILRTSPAERAWPLYIEARVQFGQIPETIQNLDPRRPGDQGWDEMARWLETKQGAMDLVRTAAAKPVLGYVYSADTDPELGRAIELTNPGYVHQVRPDVPENPMLIGVLLPHLGEMRRYARWLASDASLAASRGEGARFLSDVHALLGMASQALDEQFLISDLVGVAIADLTMETLRREAAREGLLSTGELRDLAHTVSAFAGGRLAIDAAPELLGVEDILQRYFSDDGEGDGRFVGGVHMETMYEEWGIARPAGLPLLRAAQPVQSVLMSSRAEIMDRARRLVAAAHADDALPPWRHDERTSDGAYTTLMDSGLYDVVPFLRSLQSGTEEGPFLAACAARDIFEARRDAVLTILAIEAFRRARGDWPASLTELSPAFLPRIPRDSFDGAPLRYKPAAAVGGLPTLYSVGADGVDDGGVPPSTRKGRQNAHSLRLLAIFRSGGVAPTTAEQHVLDAARGDWVLWPDPPAPLEADN